MRQVERQSASNCRRNGVNPAISTKGTISKNRITATTTTKNILRFESLVVVYV